MDTLTSILATPAAQSAMIAAASHVLVWLAKKIPSLPGGYSSAKRALALKVISWAKATDQASQKAAQAPADQSHLNAPL